MKNIFCGIWLMMFLFVMLNGQITNIQVNAPELTSPNEVTIAINPAAPDTLVAGSNLKYFYYSHNGGLTWTQGTLEDPNYGVWGDPVTVFDSDGNCYFGHLSNPIVEGGYWIDRIVVQKSIDGGVSWQNGVGVGFNPPFRRVQDKEWLAVDLTDSEYHNNIYMAWTEFDSIWSPYFDRHRSRIRFSRSTDQGASWAPAFIISDVDGNCLDGDGTTEGAVPAIGPEGEVFIAWSDSFGIKFDRSLDGGVTFGEDVFVSDQPGGWDFHIPGIYRCNGMPVTACDVSTSQYRGNIYVMWSDQRNGTTNTDVFVSKSVDGGDTWSSPKKVNDDDSGRHQFFPWMCIDQSTGIIYIVFYDRRHTEENTTDVFLARSDDGAETFVNTRISVSSFIPDEGVFFGDYTNIAALNGKIYPIWMRYDFDKIGKRSIWMAPLDDSQLVTSIEEQSFKPAGFILSQNYPNPFNATTKIDFYLDKPGDVNLDIFDVTGKQVANLVDKLMRAGQQSVSFHSGQMASGTYFYTLRVNDRQSKTRKMQIIK